jgi:hypothetical protein
MATGGKPLVVLIRLCVILAPTMAVVLGGMLYRSQYFSAPSAKPAAPKLASASVTPPPSPRSTQQSPNDGRDLFLLSKAPLVSSPAFWAAVDPDPDASFRRLITPPPQPAQPLPHVDPRKLRTILDRGVVTYAAAANDADRTKGASLIQMVALLGYPQARELLARNYPSSAAVRSVVPADDAIRYALGFLMEPASAEEEAKQLLLVLARHFSLKGELDLFATQLINFLRADRHSKLEQRIDTLFELLPRVRGSCVALASVVTAKGDPLDRECSSALAERLRRHVEVAAPIGQEEESRRRGLVLLSQSDFR